MTERTAEEMAEVFKRAASAGVPPNKYPNANWNIVYHRMQKGRTGTPDCDCPMCVADKQRLADFEAALKNASCKPIHK